MLQAKVCFPRSLLTTTFVIRTLATLTATCLFGASRAQGTCSDPYNVDVLNIASNSLRSQPNRGAVKADFVARDTFFKSDPLATVGWAVTLPWDLSSKQSYYLSHPQAGKVVVFYVNDAHSPGEHDPVCDSLNLDAGCADQSFADVLSTVDAWQGNEARLVLIVHLDSGIVVNTEAQSLEIAHQSIPVAGLSVLQAIELFLSLTTSDQCQGGGDIIIGV